MDIKRESFRPSPENVELIERCAANVQPETQTLANWHRQYLQGHKERLAFDLEITKEWVAPNCAILECGSIPLGLTLALAELRYDIAGCDIAPERYKSAIENAGLSVKKCNIETERLPFEDGQFDAVLFNELFEHLRINLIFTMSEIRRVLKPGGIILLSTPNLRSLKGLFNFIVRNQSCSCAKDIYEEYEKLERLGHMGHVREYTTTEVTGFLEKLGFRVQALVFRGSYPGHLLRGLLALFPRLRPFVTYVAVKIE